MPFEGKTKDDHEKLIDELYDELDTQQTALATAMSKVREYSEGQVGFGECFQAVNLVHKSICELFRKITNYKYR